MYDAIVSIGKKCAKGSNDNQMIAQCLLYENILIQFNSYSYKVWNGHISEKVLLPKDFRQGSRCLFSHTFLYQRQK